MSEDLDHVTQVSRAVRAARAASRALYGGAQYRIEIGAAIAELSEPRVVTTAQTVRAISGISRQSVHHELRALEAAGLLTREDLPDRREVYWVPVDSLYWSSCLELRDRAEERLDRRQRF